MDWKPHYFYAFPLYHCQLPAEEPARPINRTPHCSTMNNTTMVYASTEPNRPPSSTSPVGYSSSPAPQQCSSSPQQAVAIDSLQSIRESFRQRAISSKATNIILQSWSVGTKSNIPLMSRSGITVVLNGKLIHTIHL